MFTNEVEFDTIITTILDESADFEDVQIIYNDTSIYVRQFNNESGDYDLVQFTPLMFAEFMESYKQAQGAFRVEFPK